MTNISTWRTAHTCELGLPTAYAGSLGIAGRVASLRVRTVAVEGTVMPVSTGDVSLLVDRAAVAGVAVKDAFAFPGPSTWSPPI
jgi:hypothetical protein